MSYCESTLVRGVLIFVVFVCRPNHEIWLPTKKKIPLICTLKTWKPRIQESTNLRFFPYPRKSVSTNKGTFTVREELTRRTRLFHITFASESIYEVMEVMPWVSCDIQKKNHLNYKMVVYINLKIYEEQKSSMSLSYVEVEQRCNMV